ncbi:hypothetical protein M2323_004146 [Rhodoblastus acidophilus]|nr:hypothetical protein [Rhodoblastus acidophilus]MCW2335200.1 hypothetical protein [Rhodoblastus acidophilus]
MSVTQDAIGRVHHRSVRTGSQGVAPTVDSSPPYWYWRCFSRYLQLSRALPAPLRAFKSRARRVHAPRRSAFCQTSHQRPDPVRPPACCGRRNEAAPAAGANAIASRLIMPAVANGLRGVHGRAGCDAPTAANYLPQPTLQPNEASLWFRAIAATPSRWLQAPQSHRNSAPTKKQSQEHGTLAVPLPARSRRSCRRRSPI